MSKVVSLTSRELMQVADPRVDVEREALRAVDADADEMKRRTQLKWLWRHVKKLPDHERKVVCWRAGLLGEPRSLQQIAKSFGVSSAYVWQLEQRGLARLRQSMEADFGLAA